MFFFHEQRNFWLPKKVSDHRRAVNIFFLLLFPEKQYYYLVYNIVRDRCQNIGDRDIIVLSVSGKKQPLRKYVFLVVGWFFSCSRCQNIVNVDSRDFLCNTQNISFKTELKSRQQKRVILQCADFTFVVYKNVFKTISQ